MLGILKAGEDSADAVLHQLILQVIVIFRGLLHVLPLLQSHVSLVKVVVVISLEPVLHKLANLSELIPLLFLGDAVEGSQLVEGSKSAKD